jgi:hypothetical protein
MGVFGEGRWRPSALQGSTGPVNVEIVDFIEEVQHGPHGNSPR